MEKTIFEMLTSSQKVIGTKQVTRGLSEGTVRCVIVAEDADQAIVGKITAAARERNVEVLRFPSKEELGKAVDIEVAAAVVGILK